MKTHRGMRPQDVVILLKLIALNGESWTRTGLARSLFLSQSEVSESLNRSRIAGLFDDSKRVVNRAALLEFILFGLRYVFPTHPGSMVRGMPTSHSAPPLARKIISGGEELVWPDHEGKMRGQAVEPLYPGASAAAKEDPVLYELLILVDALRVGKAREKRAAEAELRRRILLP